VSVNWSKRANRVGKSLVPQTGGRSPAHAENVVDRLVWNPLRQTSSALQPRSWSNEKRWRLLAAGRMPSNSVAASNSKSLPWKR
jgi:hypothetical protein